MYIDFKRASETTDIEDFLDMVFPPEWKAVKARILESGVIISNEMCKWTPRVSSIPFTVKKSRPNDLHNQIASVMYRVHDCIHQLWGLPLPTKNNPSSFEQYKKIQMAGEMVVLLLTEVYYAEFLYNNGDDDVKELMIKRNGYMMYKMCLSGLTPEQVLIRFDGVLHKKYIPSWVLNNIHARAFIEDYMQMLEEDRDNIDKNWQSIIDEQWVLPDNSIPPVSLSPDMDGLETTLWMLKDFYNQINSSDTIDWGLVDFNRERRKNIVLPKEWI